MSLENETLRRTSVGNEAATAVWDGQYAGSYGYAQDVDQSAAYPVGYGAGVAGYVQSPTSTPSTIGGRSPAAANWPYDYAAQGQYDPAYWNNQQGYASVYGQEWAEENDDEEDGEEEQAYQPPARRRR